MRWGLLQNQGLVWWVALLWKEHDRAQIWTRRGSWSPDRLPYPRVCLLLQKRSALSTAFWKIQWKRTWPTRWVPTNPRETPYFTAESYQRWRHIKSGAIFLQLKKFACRHETLPSHRDVIVTQIQNIGMCRCHDFWWKHLKLAFFFPVQLFG